MMLLVAKELARPHQGKCQIRARTNRLRIIRSAELASKNILIQLKVADLRAL